MTDACQRFLFDDADVRGEIVELDSVLESACENHQYPPPIARLLGEALAACALLRATIKLEGQLTLQIQGEDDVAPVSLLLVHGDDDGALRGTVRYQGEPQRGGFSQLCGNARLVVTIEPEEGQRYQGVVGAEPDGLAATLEAYFRDSEQLPTRVFLASDGARAAGLLLQRLPRSDDDKSGEMNTEAWERIGHLAATVTERELLERGAEELLHRLFHQETVRVFEPRDLYFRCRCSAERIAAILRGLEREEIDKVLEEAGEVEVRCEFCGAAYHYDRVDVEHALTEGATPGSERYH